MTIPRLPFRWAALALLGVLAALLGFLVAVQGLMAILPPGGSWQLPRIYKVTVKAFDPNPQAEYPAIQVRDAAEQARFITLPKEERIALEMDEDLWVVEPPFRSRLRPPQYRLTPWRLVLEFPAPVLILVVLLLVRIRKLQVRVDREAREAPRERTVLRDDFHARAQRFAPPKDEGPRP